MNRTAFLFRFPFLFRAALSLLPLLPGCAKPAGPDNGLVGEWAWVRSQGGMTGAQTYTPASTGVAVRWVFTSDSTFQAYETRQGATRQTESGTYSLGSVRSIYNGQSARALRFAPIPSRAVPGRAVTYVLEELGAQLILADNNPDGFGHTYRRR